MLPKIKDSISVLYRRREGAYEVSFLFNVSSIILSFELNEPAFRCLHHLDGQHSIDQIASIVDIEKREVRRLITTLRKARILSTSPLTESRNEEIDKRFTTQLNFFAEFETRTLSRVEMQKRLQMSHVLIIGLGGIGTWVLQGLSLAGVNQFTLVDPDVVEITNLNRQCMFTLADVGKEKVEAAANKLAQVDPRVHVSTLQRKIASKDDCVEFAQQANLIINCADEPSTDAMNRIVSEAGYELNLPHILCGGYDGHLSFIGPTVLPGKSACWYCYEHTLDRQLGLAGYKHLAITQSHIQGGNIGAISAITANYHVLEAIKVLTGFSTPTMLNRTAELDFLRFGIHFRNFKRFRSCPLCVTKKKGVSS